MDIFELMCIVMYFTAKLWNALSKFNQYLYNQGKCTEWKTPLRMGVEEMAYYKVKIALIRVEKNNFRGP